MFHAEEIELFALEEQFETAAADPALTPSARYEQMHAALQRMHFVVMSGYRISPCLGAHLADLCLDYLAREDLAPAVVRDAFARHSRSGSIINLHQHLLDSELRRTVVRLSSRAPALTASN